LKQRTIIKQINLCFKGDKSIFKIKCAIPKDKRKLVGTGENVFVAEIPIHLRMQKEAYINFASDIRSKRRFALRSILRCCGLIK
jgi:hypothetical protein